MSELPSIRYRPAVRALVIALIALGVRGAVLGALLLIMARQHGDDSFDSSDALWILPIMGLLADALALVSIGYSAIASHRREWGVTLVLAWIFGVTATFGFEPFTFVAL